MEELNNDPVTPSTLPGAFMESLRRNNKKIRDDRALQIGEAAQILYKREVEDTELKIKQLKRDREAALDLSPTTADSLVLASDFDAKKFVEIDIQRSVKIRELEIVLELAKARYTYLFGG
jgi:hypothetical protein